MLTQTRWNAEIELMRRAVPNFQPFRQESYIGFCGHLKGGNSGRVYAVVICANLQNYPLEKPKIYMNPHAESHYWMADGSLSYYVGASVWKSTRFSFARCLLFAIEYLAEFDDRYRAQDRMTGPAHPMLL